MKPNMTPLYAVIANFNEHGIDYALGGSGLLLALGLNVAVRDWDITTNAAESTVHAALTGLHVQTATSGDYPFASRYKLLIHTEEPQVEVFGDFAIHAAAGLCRLPSLRNGQVWNGIALGSPEVWYAAYALMGRQEKSSALLRYLQEHGANQQALALLLGDPFPTEIRNHLRSLQAPPT